MQTIMLITDDEIRPVTAFVTPYHAVIYKKPGPLELQVRLIGADEYEFIANGLAVQDGYIFELSQIPDLARLRIGHVSGLFR
jgi:hypothetical protein